MNPSLDANSPDANALSGNRGSGHLSTLRLHQLRLGELPPAAAAAAHAHVAGCATCSGRLGHQAALREEFLTRPVPAALRAPGLADRVRAWWSELGSARSWMLAAVPVAAVALIGVQLSDPAVQVGSEGTGRQPTVQPSVQSTEGVRSKGDAPRLEAWVAAASGAHELHPDETVAAGTRVQLKFNPGLHRFVTLAGRDGRGRVEVYGTVTAAGPGTATAPFALTLDDTPGEQRFYAILTDTRPEATGIATALARDPVAVPGAEVETLVMPKE